VTTGPRVTVPTAPAALEAELDRLIQEHTADAGEVVAARREYEERRGRVFEDEELWEAWSAAFVEWFLVERVAAGADVPVAARSLAIARASAAAGDDLAARRASLIRAYVTSHRSLFEVSALGGGRVELLDLIGGAAFAVAEPRTLHGVEVGDVAELRLIGWDGDVRFGRTFVYHPPAARAAIAGHVRALRDRGLARDAIVDHVASLRIKVDRYRHVAPAKVYELGRERTPE
jgi:hypothetical protein